VDHPTLELVGEGGEWEEDQEGDADGVDERFDELGGQLPEMLEEVDDPEEWVLCSTLLCLLWHSFIRF